MDLKEFESTVTKLNEEREKVIREHASVALGGAFKELFDKYPGLENLTWTQYTPYFNDGDECVFGLCEINNCLYEGEDHDYPTYDDKLPKGMRDDMSEIYRAMERIEDTMKLAFGDHARVTAVRGGEFKVEEYDHD